MMTLQYAISVASLYFTALCTCRYVLNVIYNDTNKTVLKVLNLPWTLSALQLGLGLLYIVPLWLVGVRKAS